MAASPRPRRAAQVLAIPVVILVLAAGIWLAGGVLTDDAGTARVLVGLWIIGLGGALAVVSRRWRWLTVPVLASWALGSAVLGGFLLLTSSVDRVVHEEVVAADDPLPLPSPSATADASLSRSASASPSSSKAGPVLIARGSFTSGEHVTTGMASLIGLPDGRLVVTLTGFATSPGPDLRVYLVPGDGRSAQGHVDLGALKGNKGDQQYVVPAGSPDGSVLIWCRAFSARFGSAQLSPNSH